MTIPKASLVESLRVLAERDFQLRVWVRGIGPEESNFEEAMCQVFDDCHLGAALSEGSVATQLGSKAAAIAVELDRAVEAAYQVYKPIGYDEVESFVESEEMVRVRSLASNLRSSITLD